MKARLLYHQKARFQDRYLMELTIHEVGRSTRYPDGVKYGLLFLDLRTGRRVLIDNHHPKGHHVHVDDEEFLYEYTNDDKLIHDFKRFVREKMGVTL
jgi:hypothetical protein